MEARRFLIAYVFAAPFFVFLTPFRYVFDFCTITCPDFLRTANNSKNHRTKVQQVQAQIRTWNRNGRKKRLCTARPSWKTLSIRHLNKSKFTQIKIDLEDIIEIDTKNRLLHVEPGMKMGTLTHKLLAKGWTIPVTPEFETLTIGGCVNGTGIETSSHKFGLFADTCVEYEVVLADGSVATCSREINSDLFFAIPWSHGTICFLTAVTIPIQPAPRFVKVEYHPTDSLVVAQTLLQNSENFDFVEGIAFGLNKFVVMYGTFTQNAEVNKVNYINRWFKPLFYQHVESMLANKMATTEYLPVRDYYHRHQRSYFWELESCIPFATQTWFRVLFGWIYPVNFQLIKFLLPEGIWDTIFDKKKHVLQDFLVPIPKLAQILELSHSEVEVYPIWLCPCKFFRTPGLAPLPEGIEETYIDIGIYGISPKLEDFCIESKIKKLEKFTIQCKGYQFLYADTYMTRDDFEQMFQMTEYNRVRQKYDCGDAFPEIYDKISTVARK